MTGQLLFEPIQRRGALRREGKVGGEEEREAMVWEYNKKE